MWWCVIADLVDFDFERNDAVVFEATGSLRCERALVAAIREGVSFFARDIVLARDVFGGQAHAQIHVRVVLDKIWIRPESGVAAQHAHGFRATRYDALGHSRHDALGGHRDGL